MKSTLLKIVLLSGVVLSLFILLLRVYFQHMERETPSLSKEHNTSFVVTKERSERNITDVSHIKAILNQEENHTLEKAYKSVASEIEDFIAAKRAEGIFPKKSEQKTEKKFVSKCPTPPKSLTLSQNKKRETAVSKIAKNKKKAVVKKSRVPRVVIIMDDVRSVEQGRVIKQLPIKVTPSIFPVTSDHPNTRRVAAMFDCFMVHTPMEALNYPREEKNTLRANDTLEQIDRKIAAIKRDFPKLTAINNHTGSRFTSDDAAMDRLFCALKKYDIRFIDSRTCPDSVAVAIGKLHGEKVYSRNVFLDNVDDVQAILARLKETVRYAKKHQLAIAICHPRPATFEALKLAKRIMKGVQVVSVDTLYR
jgi:polysaccharide deacetylase 2 family uncharacterized protein YibQ